MTAVSRAASATPVVEERAQRASRDLRRHPGGRGASAASVTRPAPPPGGRGASAVSAVSVTRPAPDRARLPAAPVRPTTGSARLAIW
ncbi:hypothetical protein NOCARDAX2BIS_460134 [Nocardioides sp. AX2bis]|nr:hypothetical protein NOCARDAX2BIS_460134 [Nocardioides sp. AX2bis]